MFKHQHTREGLIMLQYLSTEDWEELSDLFPSAYFFLLRRSVHKEHAALKRLKEKGGLNIWQKERLAELDAIFEEVQHGET